YFTDGVTKPIYLTVGSTAGISIPRTGDAAARAPWAMLMLAMAIASWVCVGRRIWAYASKPGR
ncbi:MAG: hypothetical protein LBN26_04355, partial [Christensenellaceae bacterium]|nr:hypothetical protein [Christensenellaceae bacterium]